MRHSGALFYDHPLTHFSTRQQNKRSTLPLMKLKTDSRAVSFNCWAARANGNRERKKNVKRKLTKTNREHVLRLLLQSESIEATGYVHTGCIHEFCFTFVRVSFFNFPCSSNFRSRVIVCKLRGTIAPSRFKIKFAFSKRFVRRTILCKFN